LYFEKGAEKMKTIQTLVFVILLGSLLAGCGTVAQPSATPFAESMKGYELYSWQEDGQWKFSVLVGTNREKTLDEIKSTDIVLSGVDALTSTLEKIPAGQYIIWSSRETLSLPPEDIRSQVEQVCKDRGLILNIAS
jgi:1-deoxy-D-xylulose 5-phosphate reductoisomerase